MYLDRILYPVTALGPGNRVAVWTAGCGRKCAGCANPELWDRHPQQSIEPKRAAGYIHSMIGGEGDGLTITGGEPFDQARDLVRMIDALVVQTEIFVFSGYQIAELQDDAAKRELLSRIDVLVDGNYIEALNDGVSALRGSANQQIHYLNEDVRDKYEQYIREGRKIQNFVYDYKTLSVGIHNPPVGSWRRME